MNQATSQQINNILRGVNLDELNFLAIKGRYTDWTEAIHTIDYVNNIERKESVLDTARWLQSLHHLQRNAHTLRTL